MARQLGMVIAIGFAIGLNLLIVWWSFLAPIAGNERTESEPSIAGERMRKSELIGPEIAEFERFWHKKILPDPPPPEKVIVDVPSQAETKTAPKPPELPYRLSAIMFAEEAKFATVISESTQSAEIWQENRIYGDIQVGEITSEFVKVRYRGYDYLLKLP